MASMLSSDHHEELLMMDLESDDANMDDFFQLFHTDPLDPEIDSQDLKRRKVEVVEDEEHQVLANQNMDSLLEISMTGTTVGAPTDPRVKYGDIITEAFNRVNDREIYNSLKDIVEEDFVWVASWLNQVKLESKKCREIHGLACASRFMSNVISSSPDMVITLKEKVLYRKPDDSSFLVMKVCVTGNYMWSILMNNALSAGRRLFSRTGFFGRIFRFDQPRANNEGKTSSSLMHESDNSTARSEADTSRTTSHMSSQSITNPKTTNSTENIVDISATEQSPIQALVEETQNRKRKKAPRQQSMMHRNFLNFRKQKILPEEVELGLEDASFELRRVKRTGSYIVSITIVCHINPEHRIYKVESFKHLDWRQLHR